MLKQLALSLSIVCCQLAAPVYAADDNDDLDSLQFKLTNQWQLIKNDKRRDIKTYAKQEDNRPFRSFKVESTLNGSMSNVVKILADFNNYKKWYWETRDSKLLKTVSPTEHYVYMVNNAPYGLPDRDAVLHVKVLPQTEQKQQLAFLIEAVPDFLPPKNNMVRINAEDMLLTLTPLNANSVHLIAEGYVDPGGNFPNWANNLVQRTAPYSILVGLQRMLAMNEKNTIQIPFPVFEARHYQ